MVGNADQASDSESAVEHELAGFLGGTCQFTLEHRINEAHGELHVVKEVGDAVADGSRYDYDISVCQGAPRMGVELVVETEYGSVEALERIIHFLHRDIRKIVSDSRRSRANGFGGRIFP